jgi:hypothetical protein
MNVVTSLESCAACFDRLEVARSTRLAAAPVPLAAALTPAMCAVTSCVAWLTLRVIPAGCSAFADVPKEHARRGVSPDIEILFRATRQL